MELLFDSRETYLFHPAGDEYPFPLERGDIISFRCHMMKLPAFPEFDDYAEDVRWGAEFYPHPHETYSSEYDTNFIRIKANLIYPREEPFILGWHPDHEDTFLAFAIGDQFDYIENRPITSMLVRILAIVNSIWPFDFDGKGEELWGRMLPYGKKVDNLISQEIEVIDPNYY